MKKTRFLSLMLCALCTIAALMPGGAAYADAIGSENADINGALVPLSEYTNSDTLTPDWEWTTSGSAESAISEDGTSVTFSGISGTVSAEFSGDTVSLDGYMEVGFTIRTVGGVKCSVSLEAQFGEAVVRTAAEAPSGSESCIFVRIPDGEYYLTGMSVKLTFVGSQSSGASATVRAVTVSPDDHLKPIQTYSAVRLAGTEQTYIGKSIVSIAANHDEYAARLRITAKNGAVTFSLSQNGKDFTVIGSSVLSENRNEYLFSVSGIRAPSEYKVEFTGSGDTPVLEGVDFIPLSSSSTTPKEELGKITKCAVSDDWKTLSVSGTITRDAAIKYIDAEICLFGVRMWDGRDTAMRSEPLATLKMSTSFTFTVSDPGDAMLFSSYFIAIRSDGNYTVASGQEYPAYPTVRSQMPALAAYGITPAEAFSYGFDGYIIDVDATSLLAPSANFNSQIFTIDTSYYYLNNELISEVDRTAEFLSKAGISPIIRLDVSASKFGNSSERACKSVAAAVSFLAERYSPSGIILRFADVGSVYSSRSAANAANMLRLSYAAAGRFAVSGESGTAIIAEVQADRDKNPETAAWLLSREIAAITKSPIRMVFTGVQPSAASIAQAKALVTAVSDGGSSAEFTLCFDVTGDELQGIGDVLDSAALKNAVFSISDSSAISLEFDSYEDTRAAIFGAEDEGAVLWDFTRSYDSAGFSGSCADALFTTESRLMESYTGIPACRALTANLAGVSDVILAEPASPLNLSDTSCVSFLLAAESDGPFSLDIIFISGKTRTLFTASFDGSGVFSPVCDLSSLECAKKVDRIAIVLREGTDVRLGIARVTAGGGADSIRDLYITETTAKVPEPVKDTHVMTPDPAVLAVIGVVIVTIVIFALLSRKHDE